MAASGAGGGGATSEFLDVLRDSYPDFIAVIAADPAGIVTAASPRLAPDGSPPLTGQVRVDDRASFRVATRESGNYASRVVPGHESGSGPIVALSAAIPGPDGKSIGVVQGLLDLGRLGRFDIAGTRGGDALTALMAVEGVQAITHRARTRDAVLEDSVLARYRTAQGWDVIVWRPVASLAPATHTQLLLAASMLLGAGFVALLIARWVATTVAGPLNWLLGYVSSMQPEQAEVSPRLPRRMPLEFASLFHEFRRLLGAQRSANAAQAAALAQSERLREEMEAMVRDREFVILQRTSELRWRSKELEQANSQLARLAREDSLIALANRRSFEDALERAWRVGERDGSPVALMVLDVDHFKALNDAVGHQAGDECLRRMANCLAGFARRPLDLVARDGGEEFCSLLGATPLSDAFRTAGAVHRVVRDLAIPHPATEAGIITVSIGVAAAIPSSEDSTSSLLRRADQAMYQAKQSGRDRVAAAGPVTEVRSGQGR